MQKLGKHLVLKFIFIVWVLFASLYVVYGEYTRLNVYVAQNAYSQGYQDSVMQLMSEAEKCEPIPVTFDDKTINVIATNCANNLGTE